MRCTSCSSDAIIGQPPRCKEHFISDFEARVRCTIERFGLIRQGQRIAVAASGGKDSLTVLTLLKRWYGDVTAILVDEGIAGYREHTEADLRRVCDAHGIPLIVVSYREMTGLTLDEMLARRRMHACTVCGTLRRHLISVASRGFDVLATGHNMDDEAQTVLMNLLRGNTGVFPRGGPKTGVGATGFTQRVKPLYFCTEKEVATYAFLNGFVGKFVECPNAQDGYRRIVRDELNRYAQSHPQVRMSILESFLSIKERFPVRDAELPRCGGCGEPSSRDPCKACEFTAVFR